MRALPAITAVRVKEMAVKRETAPETEAGETAAIPDTIKSREMRVELQTPIKIKRLPTKRFRRQTMTATIAKNQKAKSALREDGEITGDATAILPRAIRRKRDTRIVRVCPKIS